MKTVFKELFLGRCREMRDRFRSLGVYDVVFDKQLSDEVSMSTGTTAALVCSTNISTLVDQLDELPTPSQK